MSSQLKTQKEKGPGSKAHVSKAAKDVLFIVKFELGDELSDQIVFRKDDISEELALAFCEKHKLGVPVYNTIVNALDEKFKIVQGLNSHEKNKKPAPENKRQEHLLNSLKANSENQVHNQSTAKKYKEDSEEQLSPGTLISNAEFEEQHRSKQQYNIYGLYKNPADAIT